MRRRSAEIRLPAHEAHDPSCLVAAAIPLVRAGKTLVADFHLLDDEVAVVVVFLDLLPEALRLVAVIVRGKLDGACRLDRRGIRQQLRKQGYCAWTAPLWPIGEYGLAMRVCRLIRLF